MLCTRWILIQITGLLLLIAASTEEDEQQNSIVYPEELRQNVSCNAHDVKFTCDCQNSNSAMQLPHLIGFIYQVIITNCKSLTMDANTLESIQGLRKVTLRNIRNLILQKNSLSFPKIATSTPLIIEFDEVHFKVIDSHAINGNIEEVSFIGGQIDVIHPFGFTTLNEKAILLKMNNVVVKKMEPQAFKKFAIEQLEITNCRFETSLPSKSFYELEIFDTLRINNVQFKEVHSKAFTFKMVSKLSISNSHFDGADAEWIEAHVRESAIIRDNNFGNTTSISFRGLTVHRHYIASEKMELRFSNNTIRFPLNGPRPLEFNEQFRLNIEQIYYLNQFSCRDLNTNLKPPQPREKFFQKFSDKILFQRGDNQSFLTISKIIQHYCTQSHYLMYIILIAVVLLLVIIIIVVVIIWLRISKKKKKRKKMDVVLPEPRTYKETQIVYQIENAGLLKTDL